MGALSIHTRIDSDDNSEFVQSESHVLAFDSRYEVKIASKPSEVTSALKLRYEVFANELKALDPNDSNLDVDMFDFRCKHLIVSERRTSRTIGTYRLNSLTGRETIKKLYSYDEFTIENLPETVLRNSLEAGRACIAADHRGSKVLYLMWKALAKYLQSIGKRYVFGCCSIFTDDRAAGGPVYRRLLDTGHVSESFVVNPRQDAITLSNFGDQSCRVELPLLFEMYLKLGAKVCGPPIYDDLFRSLDFFVLFDIEEMTERYKRLLLS